jgi:hypothetical protein
MTTFISSTISKSIHIEVIKHVIKMIKVSIVIIHHITILLIMMTITLFFILVVITIFTIELSRFIHKIMHEVRHFKWMICFTLRMERRVHVRITMTW